MRVYYTERVILWLIAVRYKLWFYILIIVKYNIEIKTSHIFTKNYNPIFQGCRLTT